VTSSVVGQERAGGGWVRFVTRIDDTRARAGVVWWWTRRALTEGQLVCPRRADAVKRCSGGGGYGRSRHVRSLGAEVIRRAAPAGAVAADAKTTHVLLPAVAAATLGRVPPKVIGTALAHNARRHRASQDRGCAPFPWSTVRRWLRCTRDHAHLHEIAGNGSQRDAETSNGFSTLASPNRPPPRFAPTMAAAATGPARQNLTGGGWGTGVGLAVSAFVGGLGPKQHNPSTHGPSRREILTGPGKGGRIFLAQIPFGIGSAIPRTKGGSMASAPPKLTDVSISVLRQISRHMTLFSTHPPPSKRHRDVSLASKPSVAVSALVTATKTSTRAILHYNVTTLDPSTYYCVKT